MAAVDRQVQVFNKRFKFVKLVFSFLLTIIVIDLLLEYFDIDFPFRDIFFRAVIILSVILLLGVLLRWSIQL